MQNATIQNIYSILFAATILTIFEIVFFYIIIAPGVKGTMNENLNKLVNVFSNKLNKVGESSMEGKILTSSIFNSKLGNMFKVFRIREDKLVNKINMYTIYTGIIILVSLVITVYSLYRSLDTGTAKTPTIFAIFTVICLIIFQIFFYFYGLKYKYPGSEGSEELIKFIYDNLNIYDKPTTVKKLREYSDELSNNYSDNEILQLEDNNLIIDNITSIIMKNR